MKRALLLVALGIAAGAASALLPAEPPPAEARTAAQAIGTYVVKLRGDGWSAKRPETKITANGLDYRAERIAGAAVLTIRPRDPQLNDGLVTVDIVLDEAASAGLLGSATPGTPAFKATGAIVGDGLALVSSGQPNYVNALTLRFDTAGRKITGTWMAVYPATEPGLATLKFATGVTVTLTGRRTLRPVR